MGVKDATEGTPRQVAYPVAGRLDAVASRLDHVFEIVLDHLVEQREEVDAIFLALGARPGDTADAFLARRAVRCD
mgnify:CR=1 FL=1